jgi:hypothetical protein
MSARFGCSEAKAMLNRTHPDFLLFAPYDPTGQIWAIARHTQHEAVGHPDLVRYLDCGAGGGQITDQAIDCAAAKRNRSGFQNPMAGCSAAFGHGIKRYTKLLRNLPLDVPRAWAWNQPKCPNIISLGTCGWRGDVVKRKWTEREFRAFKEWEKGFDRPLWWALAVTVALPVFGVLLGAFTK